MRLIEQHGDGAEIAAVLRARIRSIQDDELTREAVLSAVLRAIAELRDSGNRSRHYREEAARIRYQRCAVHG
jgi:predicted AAA+ superfamily ATPase